MLALAHAELRIGHKQAAVEWDQLQSAIAEVRSELAGLAAK